MSCYKKGRETEKKTANVQKPRAAGVVRTTNPILHNDLFLFFCFCFFFYGQTLLYIVRIFQEEHAR